MGMATPLFLDGDTCRTQSHVDALHFFGMQSILINCVDENLVKDFEEALRIGDAPGNKVIPL